MKKRKIRLLLLPSILVLTAGIVSAAGAAAIKILPIIDSGQVSGGMDSLAWDGQRLWATAEYILLKVEMLPQIPASFATIRSIQALTWDGQYFLGSSPEVVWQFNDKGEDIGHYILPRPVYEARVNSLAYDGDSAGGPFLWILTQDGSLHQAVLVDPIVIKRSFKLLSLSNQQVLISGLAWDGQNLWTSVHLEMKNNWNSYSSTHLWKISPTDGSLVDSYDMRIYRPYSYWNNKDKLAVDRQSPGGPYLYLAHEYYDWYIYKISTQEETRQLFFMPWISPKTWSWGYPFPPGDDLPTDVTPDDGSPFETPDPNRTRTPTPTSTFTRTPTRSLIP